MKTISLLSRVPHLTVLGLLATLVGCANVPTRHASTGEYSPPAFAANQDEKLALPVPLKTVSPVYPVEMRRAGLTGMVNVNGVIDETGKMRELKVADASHYQFIAPSLTALKKWEFKPAEREGLPVSTRIHIPIEYTFKPE